MKLKKNNDIILIYNWFYAILRIFIKKQFRRITFLATNWQGRATHVDKSISGRGNYESSIYVDLKRFIQYQQSPFYSAISVILWCNFYVIMLIIRQLVEAHECPNHFRSPYGVSFLSSSQKMCHKNFSTRKHAHFYQREIYVLISGFLIIFVCRIITCFIPVHSALPS